MRVSHIIISAGNIDKNRVQKGDILKFSDGKKYEVISYINAGNVNVVFKVRMLPPARGVPEVLALRLPKIKTGESPKNPPQEYIRCGRSVGPFRSFYGPI